MARLNKNAKQNSSDKSRKENGIILGILGGLVVAAYISIFNVLQAILIPNNSNSTSSLIILVYNFSFIILLIVIYSTYYMKYRRNK
jgi:hypothetical protein